MQLKHMIQIMKQLGENIGKILQDAEISFFIILIKTSKSTENKSKNKQLGLSQNKKKSIGSKRDKEQNEDQPIR